MLVGDLAEPDLAHQAVVLGIGIGGADVSVDEPAEEQAEFHAASLPRVVAIGRF